jgi:hypothetical protein
MSVAKTEKGLVERITVTRRDDLYYLRAARTEAPERVLAEETVDLAPAEFEDVWRTIVDEQLRSFVPEEIPNKVYDYGSTELRIETRPSKEAPLETTCVSWGRPLKNGAKIAPLTGKLARIARNRAQRVHLFYLK